MLSYLAELLKRRPRITANPPTSKVIAAIAEEGSISGAETWGGLSPPGPLPPPQPPQPPGPADATPAIDIKTKLIAICFRIIESLK